MCQKNFVCRYEKCGLQVEIIISGISYAGICYLVIASPMIGIYYLSTNFMQASGSVFLATVMSLLRQGALLIPLLYLLHAFMGMSGIAAAHMAADLLSVLTGGLLLFHQYGRLVKETEN